MPFIVAASATCSHTFRALCCHSMLPAIAWQVAAVGTGCEHHGADQRCVCCGIQGKSLRESILGGGELRAGLRRQSRENA
jgi:hypothetical protein